jgi:hypothetical protein
MLGSAAATTFGLLATLVVFLLLRGETPQLNAELPVLARYAVLFAILTALAAFSFVSLLRDSRWRWWAQAAMWGSMAALAAFYWSTR